MNEQIGPDGRIERPKSERLSNFCPGSVCGLGYYCEYREWHWTFGRQFCGFLPFLPIATTASHVGCLIIPIRPRLRLQHARREMIATITEFVNECFEFYVDFLSKRWQSLSPMEYGGILIGISLVGWILMKNGNKR